MPSELSSKLTELENTLNAIESIGTEVGFLGSDSSREDRKRFKEIKKQRINALKKEASPLGADLIDKKILALQNIDKKIQNGEIKQDIYSKDKLLSWITKQENVKRFVSLETALLKNQGWEAKQIEKFTQMFDVLRYVNLRTEIEINLDFKSFIIELEFIRDKLLKDSENKCIPWLKNNNIYKLSGGVSTIANNFSAIEMIAPMIVSLSVNEGYNLAKEAVQDFIDNFLNSEENEELQMRKNSL